MKIVVATANTHKLREIRQILEGMSVQLVAMSEFDVASPEESGATFEANALLKARSCVRATGLSAIADDSGLEVDALDGGPGVRSARYAGEDADDDANNARLLRELAGVPSQRRTARFVCAAAFVSVEGEEVVVRGEMPGRIVEVARGSNGFGYDPYFVSDAAGGERTNAELEPAEKDAISHRGAAFRALRSRLEPLLG